MSPLLAFDTAGPWCAACLIAGDDVVTHVDDMARGQAEHLMPMLESFLTRNGLVWRDLAVIGVGTGPGNFTGIRISVAAARGLALGLDIPAVGVTHLEAVAHDVQKPVTVCVPASRGQVYVQEFGDVAGAIRTVQEDDAETVGALRASGPNELIRRIASVALGRAATSQPRPSPCYVRPADAAPSRETVPVIV